MEIANAITKTAMGEMITSHPTEFRRAKEERKKIRK